MSMTHFASIIITAFLLVPYGSPGIRRDGVSRDAADVRRGTGGAVSTFAASKTNIYHEKEKDGSVVMKESRLLPELISAWSPYIYRVQCGGPLWTTRGSGTLVGNKFYTNRHVTMPGECFAESPRDAFTFTEEEIEHYGEKDISVIRRETPNDAASRYVLCESTPRRGGSLVIMGFPFVGSTEGLTVTRGIVSGYDGDYIVTDAKIEEGASGGAAIDIERGCFIGVPTSVKIGKFESLGRILIVR